MAHLSLTLLGQFQIRLADQLLTTFESDKVRALLCYLTVEPSGIPHSRDTLAALLWPGYGDESARTNLRQTLYHLRKLLGDERQDAAPFLLVTRQTIAFHPAAPCQVDVRQFGALLAATASHDHRTLAACAACQQRLHQAIDLYQGEFLAGFTIADSAPFEEWRRMMQEQLHGQALAVLTQLADAAEALAAFPEAQHYAERQLQLEPWREAAHRQIMRVLAQSGQRAAALAQYQRCCQTLRTELNIEPDSETTALFEHIRSGKLDRVTSDRTTNPPNHPHLVTTPPHNLPTPLTSFVGRDGELAKLLLQLQQPDCRLLTLVGPGGMGKTRLALEVARQRLGSYTDGVFLVSLAPLTAMEGVAPTIATTLGLTLSGGDPQAALLQLLAPKQLLLILDNFEHLLGAAGLVANLLQSAPRIQILVTSRTRLNLQGEHFVLVQPLSFGGALTAAETINADAVRLFVQSAQRNRPDFLLDHNNLPAVSRICQLVEGMPLGLEMAAGWVELLSLAEIAAEIEQSVDFLTAEWPNAPDRQRSMRAVFAWSWQLLTDAEQQVFRQLALFRGGFTREAADQVAGASLRVLAALVHKSLVRRVEHNAGQGSSRYDIHELLRQLAAEHLVRSSAEYGEVAARHSAFYLDYVAEREARLLRAEPREAAAEIQVEIDNIRQAWRYALQRRDLPALHRSAWALHSFYRITGLFFEAFQTFQPLVDQIPTLAGPDQRLTHWQPSDPPLSRLGAICAHLLVTESKLDRAIVVAQQALAQAEAEKATDAAALSHFSWGQALFLQGRLADSQHHFEQSLQLARLAPTLPHKSELLYDVECLAGIWLGLATADQGSYQQAREQVGQSLHLARTLGKRRMEMTALINLANIARTMGAYSSAQQEYEHALQLMRQVNYRWGEGAGQLELGDVARLQGEYSRAVTLLENALTIFQEIGALDKRAITLSWLGRLYAYMGATTAAEAWLTRHQQLSEQAQGWEPAMEYNQARMVLALHRGEPKQALLYATQCWQSGQTHDLPGRQAYALIGMGSAQMQLGQLTAAQSAYEQAFALYTAIGRPDMAVEAVAGLAAIAQKQGDQQQALSLVETVLRQLAEQPGSGQDEPFFLYLTCYQTLAAAQDQRAPAILQQGCTLLRCYAEQITDEALRHSFLTNVPVHRALQQAGSIPHLAALVV